MCSILPYVLAVFFLVCGVLSAQEAGLQVEDVGQDRRVVFVGDAAADGPLLSVALVGGELVEFSLEIRGSDFKTAVLTDLDLDGRWDIKTVQHRNENRVDFYINLSDGWNKADPGVDFSAAIEDVGYRFVKGVGWQMQ